MVNWDLWLGVGAGFIFIWFILSYLIPAIILKKFSQEMIKKW